MNGTQPGAGQHADHTFEDGRKVNGNPVSARDTMGTQDIGHLADARMQVTVCQANNMIGFFRLPDQGRLIASGLKMAVQTVYTGIQCAIGEPAVSGILR
ncbi:hypothetical protein Gbfr_049_003 [Gluconobacter frateurii M-2]|nr:hypothetical protein Gbfr_049_003 [Gluconobacter frateurii M-2]